MSVIDSVSVKGVFWNVNTLKGGVWLSQARIVGIGAHILTISGVNNVGLVLGCEVNFLVGGLDREEKHIFSCISKALTSNLESDLAIVSIEKMWAIADRNFHAPNQI